jgi:hypothetical protein
VIRPLNNTTDESATTSSDVGAEKLSNSEGGDRRHRVGRADQERAVQDRKTGREHGDDAGDLASSAGCIAEIRIISKIQKRLLLSFCRICIRAFGHSLSRLIVCGSGLRAALLRENLGRTGGCDVLVSSDVMRPRRTWRTQDVGRYSRDCEPCANSWTTGLFFKSVCGWIDK